MLKKLMQLKAGYVREKFSLNRFSLEQWKANYIWQNREKYLVVDPHAISRIYIEPTNRCTLDCTHCDRRIIPKDQLGTMKLDLYKKILTDLRPISHRLEVALHKQGEPMLHPHMREMIDLAKQENFRRVELSTNATVLRGKKIDTIIESGLDDLTIAFTGPSKDEYDTIHVHGRYENTLKNIIAFFHRLYESGRYKTLCVNLCFVRRRYYPEERLRRHSEFWSHFPFDSYPIFKMVNFRGAITEEHPMTWSILKPEEYDTIKPENYPVCSQPWRDIFVGWDGRLFSCVFDPCDHYIVGYVDKENVLDVWNNERMQRFRKACIDREYEGIETSGTFCSRCSALWEQGWAETIKARGGFFNEATFQAIKLAKIALFSDPNTFFKEDDEILQKKYEDMCRLFPKDEPDVWLDRIKKTGERGVWEDAS